MGTCDSSRLCVLYSLWKVAKDLMAWDAPLACPPRERPKIVFGRVEPGPGSEPHRNSGVCSDMSGNIEKETKREKERQRERERESYAHNVYMKDRKENLGSGFNCLVLHTDFSHTVNFCRTSAVPCSLAPCNPET